MNSNQLLRVCSCIFLSLILPCLTIAAENAEKEAQAVAEQWLTLIDDGKFAESWQGAASVFQAAVTQQQWQSALDTFRKPLGSLIVRKLQKAQYATTLPGAPDGHYVVLQFDTSFANKKAAVETVTPMQDQNGKWKVSGYFIK
jgi:hypothetical protein